MVSGRVVAMTSLSGFYARVDEKDIQSLQTKGLTEVYARSKRLLADGMLWLEEQMNTTVRFIPAHPGISATGLFSEQNGAYAKGFLRVAVPVMRRVFMPPEEACMSALHACCQPVPKGCLVEPRGFMNAWGLPRISPVGCRLDGAVRRDELMRHALKLLDAKGEFPDFLLK